jgi:predicted nucleic acid-binding protein
MLWLVDTNILLRVRNRSAPEYPIVRAALFTLLARGDRLCFTSQNLIEFWNVSTRPASARGGLGLSPVETDRRVRMLERLCTLLPDSPDVIGEWRRLVLNHGVHGVQVHDARLVATMNVHGIARILTLNQGDFTRYAGIAAVHPADV